MINRKEGQLVYTEMSPSTDISELNWNVHIEALLILYFLHTIYNSMDYLSLVAALLSAYTSSIETLWC